MKTPILNNEAEIMVRSATTRKEKYNAKLRGNVWNARFEALKPMMVEQINAQYPIQVFYEEKMKAYLESIGMYSIMQHHYMNFGYQLWRLSRMFTQTTLRMEALEIANKWLRRGLNATHLIHIAQLFGIDLTDWP